MPPTNRIDTVGGRYRLGERIGHGGMGEVYAAHDVRLDREVALKLLRADLADQDGMRERVLAEARLAARLTHPNVVAVLDTGEQDGRPFVVMERLSGRTLRDELDAGPMSPERIRDVGLQVLRALGAAHERGIVHRDVKPGNVLDAGVGTWKVADFGIAKWLHADETLTGTGELLGSPSYLAPERIEGREAEPASDLYAVGVLLYEALCGRRPFSAQEPIALATQIREGRFEPPGQIVPDADPEIVEVIERAMRRDPAERFTSADEMAAALSGAGAIADVGPATAPPPAAREQEDGSRTMPVPPLEQTARLPMEQVPERARRPSGPRRPLLVMGAALLAVLLVTVLAIVALNVRDVPPPDAGARTSNLPAELEEALQRLEDSVRP